MSRMIERLRVRLAGWLHTPPPVEAVTVTAVKVVDGVALLRYSNGFEQCWCPYACHVVHEICSHKPVPVR